MNNLPSSYRRKKTFHPNSHFNSVSVNDPSLNHLQVDPSLVSFNFKTVEGTDGQHNDGKVFLFRVDYTVNIMRTFQSQKNDQDQE